MDCFLQRCIHRPCKPFLCKCTQEPSCGLDLPPFNGHLLTQLQPLGLNTLKTYIIPVAMTSSWPSRSHTRPESGPSPSVRQLIVPRSSAKAKYA